MLALQRQTVSDVFKRKIIILDILNQSTNDQRNLRPKGCAP
jgi:hypothetical protein